MTDSLAARFLSGPAGSLRGLVTGWILGPLWNRRNRALNDVVFDTLHLRSDDRVLEVGFGGGYLLNRLAAVATQGLVAGIDASPAMVARCRRRFQSPIASGRVDLRAASAESLPFPDAHFDKVVSVNSIFYWPDAPGSMAEIARVLRNRGRLVLVFTDQASMRNRPVASLGIELYDQERMGALLAAAGFEGVSFTRGVDRHRVFWCAEAIRPAPACPAGPDDTLDNAT